MILSRRFVLTLGIGLGITAIVACGGSTTPNDLYSSSSSSGGPSSSSSSSSSSGTPITPPAPTEEAHVQPPSTALDVKASIIAATLGEECASGQGSGFGAPSGDCAPTPDGKGCGLTCQQSNVQISFVTGAGKNAKVEIVSVTLHDAKTGANVDALDASEPKSWTGSSYVAWNQILSPASDVKVSYNLTAPSWSTIGSSSWSQPYRLHVTMKIDGVLVVLESVDLRREPSVMT